MREHVNLASVRQGSVEVLLSFDLPFCYGDVLLWIPFPTVESGDWLALREESFGFLTGLLQEVVFSLTVFSALFTCFLFC